jgi:hypothetical protein
MLGDVSYRLPNLFIYLYLNFGGTNGLPKLDVNLLLKNLDFGVI